MHFQKIRNLPFYSFFLYMHIGAIYTKCQKGRPFAIFPDVNCELRLEMEMLKRESWRQSTSSPKRCILVLVIHIAWSLNMSS
jgi:hypothetical protein